MQKFFIKHKLSTDDVIHLSDSDSKNIIEQKILKVEDLIEIETYEKKFLGQIVDIHKNTVEVQIIEDLGERNSAYIPDIAIIQSLSGSSKFTYFIEKSVEIGIEKIIPIESTYSLKTVKQALKDFDYWNKLVKDATEQSRNIFPTIIEKPLKISELLTYDIPKESIKLCLSTEVTNAKRLKDSLKNFDISKPVYIAIGPEKGWNMSDINIFKSLDFQFIKLKGNILRTETTGLVIGSIIKYLKNQL
jgi:16S rRNA (uracil1498-N3)-methyltransferase